MAKDQLGLFGDADDDAPQPALPEGLVYRPEFLSIDEERDLLRHVGQLPFASFEFHGFTGKRRVVSFGWRYDFADESLNSAADLPPFLLPLRDRAAKFAGLAAPDFPHALVTEYAAGAGIGWHRDKSVFEDVVGISLGSPCALRFRRRRGDKWERATLRAEPRSAYLLRGPARTEWEHSIPAVDALRYSITFRSVRPRGPSTRSSSPAAPNTGGR
jgi:alkylated DNA repair dioxygenase AlkB